MIDIKNNNVKMFLKTIFNKSMDSITTEELNTLTKINFTKDENSSNDFALLSNLPNIKEIIVTCNVVANKV